MLFEEILNEYKDEVEAAVDQLYDTAYQNQVYDTDLLLVLENGLKKDYDEATLKRMKMSPYQIGLDFIGFRYDTFHQFINYYRTGIKSKDEFLKEFEDDKTRDSFLDFYRDFQLLLYMKFWETDLILRRLLNLSNLAQGKPYFWEYSQQIFNKRRNIIQDQIRKPLKDFCPHFYSLIGDIYFNQIRNAVAHSQYYFLYDSVNLTNKDENRYYNFTRIKYEDWEIMFSKLMLLYNFMIRNFIKYSGIYKTEVQGKQNGLLVRFPDLDEKGVPKSGWLKYDFDFNRWYWNYPK